MSEESRQNYIPFTEPKPVTTVQGAEYAESVSPWRSNRTQRDASVVAYRTARDSWFICIPAAACIADSLREKPERDPAERWYESLGVFAAVVTFGRDYDANYDDYSNNAA